MAACRVPPAALAVLVVAAVLGAGGCARPVSGTPVAVPGQAGVIEPPTDLLSTTCRQYTSMTQTARRDVLVAIGQDGNRLVAADPDLWAGMAAALCSIADPGAPVRDVVTGGLR